VVFVGSGPWARAALSGLVRCAGMRIALIITDQSSQSQLSMAARGCDVQLFESWDLIQDRIASAKLGVCAGWKRIPNGIYDLPPMGFVNVHGSLLPKYRGPEPLERQYLDGVTEAGATIHQIAARIDAGAVFAQKAIAISPSASIRDYMMKLTLCAAGLVRDSIARIAAGTLCSVPQDEDKASSFPFLAPDDGRLTLDEDPGLIFRKIGCLGMRGWARIAHEGIQYMVHAPELLARDYAGPCGIEVGGDGSALMIKARPLVMRALVHGHTPVAAKNARHSFHGADYNGKA